MLKWSHWLGFCSNKKWKNAKGTILTFRFDGQLSVIVVTCLCPIHQVNGVSLFRFWLCVRHKCCCYGQIPEREGGLSLTNRKAINSQMFSLFILTLISACKYWLNDILQNLLACMCLCTWEVCCRCLPLM